MGLLGSKMLSSYARVFSGYNAAYKYYKTKD